jgi:hypothetical protein
MPTALSTESYLDMDYAYAHGAFAAAGAVADIDLFNMSESQVTVHDIRPVNIVRECMPLAALIEYLSEGGDPIEVHFDMDAESPAARDSSTGKPYFENNPPIAVAPLQQQGFRLSFDTTWGAYSFDVAVDYDIKGIRYTAIFDHSGTPFRIAANLCPPAAQLLGLPEASIAHMKSLRFQNIRRRSGAGIEVVSPDEEARSCFQ